MSQHVEYEYTINYRYLFGLDELYPAVDLQISTDHGSTGVVAVLDTGAMRTVLSGEYAEAVGIELSQGTAIRLSTLAGAFVVREFTVRLQLLDLAIDMPICFSDQTLRRNILGRDILELLQVGIREYHSMLFITPSP